MLILQNTLLTILSWLMWYPSSSTSGYLKRQTKSVVEMKLSLAVSSGFLCGLFSRTCRCCQFGSFSGGSGFSDWFGSERHPEQHCRRYHDFISEAEQKKVGLLNSEAAQVAWLILVYSLPCFRRQMAFTFLVSTVLFGAQLFVILVIATNVVCISWLVSLTNI